MPSEPRTPVSNAQWTSRSVGKRWQYAIFSLLVRAGGRRIGYLCMYVVVAWYVLLRPFVRRRCRYYLNRRFPDAKNPLVRLWHDYRRIEALGESLLDRSAYGLLGPEILKLTFPEGPRMRELIREGRGLIILSSHVGCWQVAMAAFALLRVPVHIVMHKEAGDVDPRWFHYAGRQAPFAVIDPAQPMGGVLQMIAALKDNYVLAMMGDRVFGGDPNTLPARFLGAPVHFPVSPYRLASMQGSPIAVVSSYKAAYSHYQVEMTHIIRVPAGLGRANAAYAPYLHEYVEVLEDFTAAHPWQFFNFHDMWQA
ncbi:MAG: lysophospholipid acyltransferase family protein [Sedimentisphaerales bacterium]|nr:lysophospholipid acyltransferase family protein [Sedimentisphaerales bacterium]